MLLLLLFDKDLQYNHFSTFIPCNQEPESIFFVSYGRGKGGVGPEACKQVSYVIPLSQNCTCQLNIN